MTRITDVMHVVRLLYVAVSRDGADRADKIIGDTKISCYTVPTQQLVRIDVKQEK